MNEITSNFERLVLGCMDSYDSNQILILKNFDKKESPQKIVLHKSSP